MTHKELIMVCLFHLLTPSHYSFSNLEELYIQLVNLPESILQMGRKNMAHHFCMESDIFHLGVQQLVSFLSVQSIFNYFIFHTEKVVSRYSEVPRFSQNSRTVSNQSDDRGQKKRFTFLNVANRLFFSSLPLHRPFVTVFLFS